MWETKENSNEPKWDAVPNDSSKFLDDGVTPAGGHYDCEFHTGAPHDFLFMKDAPGFQVNTIEAGDFLVYRANFYTFCRVDFVSPHEHFDIVKRITTFGNILRGSRCSDKLKKMASVNCIPNNARPVGNRFLHKQRNVAGGLLLENGVTTVPENHSGIGVHLHVDQIHAVQFINN